MIARTALVPAPVAAVWPLVSSADRLPDWYTLADRVDVVSGSGAGELRLAHARHREQRRELDQEVVEFAPESVVAWRQTAERLDGAPAEPRAKGVVFRVRLSEEDGGTRVRLESEQTPIGVGRALAMHFFGAAAIRRSLDECLVRLTRSLEQDR